MEKEVEKEDKREEKDKGKDFVSAIMNPVRQRIIQFLAIHDKGTAGEIKDDLSDVPTASLYRHIKVLLDVGFIEICEEKQVRGAIEKTYTLVKQPTNRDLGQNDIAGLLQFSIMSLLTSFQQYFAGNDIDPLRDMLLVSTSTLMMSDEEFQAMLEKIGAILKECIENKPGPGRRPRRFSVISTPCEEERFP